jgi:hypothetical protein
MKSLEPNGFEALCSPAGCLADKSARGAEDAGRFGGRGYEQKPTLPSQEQPLLMQAHLCLNCWQYGISGFGVRVT